MKKRFLSPWLVAFVLAFGLMFSSSTVASAQSGDNIVVGIDKMIANYSSSQQAYSLNSAKWDALDDVINHLQSVRNGVSNSPAYLDYNSNALNKNLPVFKKTENSILHSFTGDQLAIIQAKYDQMTSNGDTSSSAYLKMKYVLEVNAY